MKNGMYHIEDKVYTINFYHGSDQIYRKLKNGKQIADFLDIKKCQKRPQTRKPIFLGL